MGCASSKQKRCRHCRAPYSPVPRSYSMHVVHPPQRRGDTYHLVALTSTTLGSLSVTSTTDASRLDDGSKKNTNIDPDVDISLDRVGNGPIRNLASERNPVPEGLVMEREFKEVRYWNENGDHGKVGGFNNYNNSDNNNKEEFLLGLIEAKTWSNMIDGKIPRKKAPKTPVMTPPGEPEMINAWEIMEGLEDMSPLQLPHRFRSFSFDVSREERHRSLDVDSPKLVVNNNNHNNNANPESHINSNVRPIWVQLVEEDDNSSHPEFDPEVLSAFRKSFQELSPDHPFYLKPKLHGEKVAPLDLEGIGDEDIAEKGGGGFVSRNKQGKQRVVVYFTSLRGVRKTYEDCCNVRMILKGLGVKLDERDVSMHSGFKEELMELLGEGYLSRPGGLPRVFIGKEYIGGAEEIKKLHEEGRLERLVEGCESADKGGRGDSGCGGNACEVCGDIRFVPCETCSGSCKVYYEAGEDEEQEALEGEDIGEFGFQRCPDCNENGLIRCPICCD